MLRAAIVQMKVGADKASNIAKAVDGVLTAAENGAKIVVLPECFNSPYGTKHFAKYAEKVPGGQTFNSLSAAAKEARVYLVGGSIPEKQNDAQGRTLLFNTSMVFAPTGDFLGKFRKMHLFDIDIPGKITFKESQVLSAGNEFFSFNVGGTPFKVGVGICYDLRFAEFADRLTNEHGCNVLIYPSAFNTTTGPLHWELLQRARAVDNQCFVLTASPAPSDPPQDYSVYGHSLIVDPMGKVLQDAGVGDCIVYQDLSIDDIDGARRNIPVLSQKRKDLY